MPATTRALLLAIALLAHGNAAQASCDANGDITGPNPATIVLGSAGCATAPGVTSATVVSGATINAAGTGVVSVASPGWAVTNQGTIGATGNAVTGDVSFTLMNSGAMTAGLSGALLGGGSTVINSTGSTIAGGFTGLSISANGGSTSGGTSTVDNAGTITSTSGFNTAIVLGLGGTVTNRSTGTISAVGVGVAGAINPTVVNNSGQILNASTGIGLSAGGSVTNDTGAVINSQSRGVDIAGGVGTVVNSGSIVANFGRPVQLQAGGSVTNTSTGTITSAGGGTRAIFVFGGPSTIVNAGSVSGGLVAAIEVESTQSSITNSGTIHTSSGAGIQLDATSASNTLTTIANNPGGTIQGAVNALVANANASVDFTNKGSVVGDLVFGAGDASLHFYTGSSLIGNLMAGSGTNAISFNGSGSGTFSKPIANFQTINKQDDGTWTLSDVVSGATAVSVTQGTLILSAANTYTGATAVNSGALIVEGSIALSSLTTVSSGATLGGSGTAGATTILSGGTFAPGPSATPGTMTVAGDLAFQSGAFYVVQVNPTTASTTNVSGAVNLTGAVLHVLAASGNYGPSTSYLIIDKTSPGPVTGSFASITTDLAFFTPTVVYNGGDGNDVVLTLARTPSPGPSPGPFSFCSVAATRNQCNVALALDQFPADNPLFLDVLFQTEDGAREAFDALSGEVHASVSAVLADESRYVREAILGRLTQATYTGHAGQVTSLGAGGPQVASLDSNAMALGYDDKSFTAPPPEYGSRLAFWTNAFGAWADFGGNKNAASTDRNLGGFVSGMDARVSGTWRLGVATGFSQSNISVDARHSAADVDSFHLAGYAGGTAGPLALRSGGAWAWQNIDTSRAVTFPGFFERQNASYNGDTGQLFGELAYPTTMGSIGLEPFAGIAFVEVNTSSFKEHGGDLSALRGREIDENVGYSTLGLRLGTVWHWSDMVLMPHASVAWQHAFDNLTPEAALTFASTGIGFDITGLPLAQDSALIDAGLDFNLSPTAILGVSYSGQLAHNLTDNAVKGRFTWVF